MEPRQIVAYSKLFLALLVAVTLFGLLIPTVRISGIAQSVQERQVEENIPKTLPLEVKLKVEKEHKFKDLNNSEWLRDFELEVSNTSGKPIYFLEFWLELPDTKSEENRQLAFSLRYGRGDFIHVTTRPIESDIPIRPGETQTFTIPDDEQQGWREDKIRRRLADPRKVRISFVYLSFGDGSGFQGGGIAYPHEKDQ